MKLRLIILLLLTRSLCVAQNVPDLSSFKTSKQKLQAWAAYCDDLIYYENFSDLRKAAHRGIILTPKNDYYNKSLFYFYGGVSFDHMVQADSATYYFEQSLAFARVISHSKRVKEALIQLSYMYVNTGTAEKRIAVINELESIADTTSNTLEKAKTEQVISNYYVNIGQYERGLHLLLNGLQTRKKYLKDGNGTDSVNYGVLLVNAADLYINLNNVNKGLGYLSESMFYMKNYSAGVAHVQKTFVKIYLQQDNVSKANTHYQKLQRYLISLTEKNFLSLAECDVLFADYYLTKNNLAPAEKYLKHASEIIRKEPNEYTEAIVNQYSGRFHSSKKEYERALSYYLKAVPVLEESSAEEKSNIHKLLAETYKAIGQFNQAFNHLSIYSSLQDTLLQEKAKKNIAEIEGKYQNDKKQQEIENLQAQTALDKLKISSAKKQRVLYIGGLLLLGIIGILLYYQNYLRKRNNESLLQLNSELDIANKTKNRFLGILNHDLRGPVASLINYLNLQQEPGLLDEAEQRRLGAKTITNAENLLQSMEDLLLWSKGQLSNFEPQPKEILVTQLFEDIQQHFSDVDTIDFLYETEPHTQIYTDEYYIKTIVRNLTSNAIKALFQTVSPTIIWRAWEGNKQLYLSITDNGPGASDQKFRALYDDSEVVGIQTGLGLHLIRDLAKAINCIIEVQNTVSGVTILLELPKKKSI